MAGEPRGWQWVAIIGGYERLLTDGDVAAALAVHTDFTKGLGGLYVDVKLAQELDPWDPFRGGGSAKLLVMPGKDETGAMSDQFGIDTHRAEAGAETPVTASVDRDDVQIAVATTTNFGATGHINLGTERIEYGSVTGTRFDMAANGRGKNVPFGRDNATRRFAQHHRATLTSDYQVPTEVLATEQPRKWKDRRVGLLLHKVTAGVLESRAAVEAAGRVWSWRISGDIADDPESGATTVVLEHELDAIAGTTLFRDPFFAKAQEGFRFREGFSIIFRDHNNVTQETADSFDVVPGAPADESELEAGYYTAEEFCTAFNAHLAAQKAAGNLHGTYTMSVSDADGEWRFRVGWRIDATALDPVWWEMRSSSPGRQDFFVFLGLDGPSGTQVEHNSQTYKIHVAGIADEDYLDEDAFASNLAPMRVWPSRGSDDGLARVLGLDEVKGTFVDQGADVNLQSTLPSWAQGSVAVFPDLEFGLFLVDRRVTVLAAIERDGSDNIIGLQQIVASVNNTLTLPDAEPLISVYDQIARRVGDGRGPLELQQVVAVEGPAKDVLPRLFYSTGTGGYNHATHDVYPYGVGIGIPHEILGDDFVNSATNLPGAHLPITLIFDKPIEVTELLESDLIIRRSHLVWKGDHLEFAHWAIPTAGQTVHTLTEANKAEPVGQTITQRSSPMITAKHAAASVKLRFNRSLATGEYLSELRVEAPSAVDAGKGEVRTISCRNVYGSSPQFQELLADFVATHNYYAEPIWVVRRPISPPLYHNVTPGQQALLSDNFARDPSTGERRITDKPTTIIRHEVALPRTDPMTGEAQPAQGYIELALIATDRVTTYAPAAVLRGSNYVAGTLTASCADHEFSAASDDLDAENFNAGDAIQFVEKDPDNPAAPLRYLRNVVSRSGNDIVHDGVALGTGGGETAFDTAKDYIILGKHYADAVAAQRGKCHQADNADARIQNLAPPFLYGNPSFSGAYTEDTSTTLGDLPADVASEDGAPRDVGYETGHLRLVESLLDRKTAVQCPGLDFDETDPSGLISGTQWYCTHEIMLYLQVQQFPTGLKRRLYASLWLRALTAGAKSARLTLTTQPITGGSLIDVAFVGIIDQVTLSSSNTTGELVDVDLDPAETDALDLAGVNHDNGNWSGVCYLYVELQDNLATRSVAHLVMGPREEAA